VVVTEVTDNEQHPHDVLKTPLLAETHDARTRRDAVIELFFIAQATDERCVSGHLLYYGCGLTFVWIATDNCNLSIKGCSPHYNPRSNRENYALLKDGSQI
jgi:hypothetical protein